jgi:ATP-dependent Lon protease
MDKSFDTYLIRRENMHAEKEQPPFDSLRSRISNTKDILSRFFLVLKKYQKEGVFQVTEVSVILDELNILNDGLSGLEEIIAMEIIEPKSCASELNKIVNKLASCMKSHGSYSLFDMLVICFGIDYFDSLTHEHIEMFGLLNKSFHPTNYKIILWSLINRNNQNGKTNSFFEDIHIAETSKTLDVFPITKFQNESLSFKVHGGKIVFTNEEIEQTIIIYGYFDDIPLNYITNKIIRERIEYIRVNTPQTEDFMNVSFNIFVDSLTLRDLLVYELNALYDMFIGYNTYIKQLNNKAISKITREFMGLDLYEKRMLLLKLLIHKDNFELQFIAYLLYDLLSLDDKTGESQEQAAILESFPNVIKESFKGAMKQTIEYTNKLNNGDVQNSLPYEQRICLMKTKDYVKEKAINKLKELKAKSEDSGSKARQYLDGLLRIPFGIYRQEPILDLMKTNNDLFLSYVNNNKNELDIEVKNKYNSMEVIRYTSSRVKKLELLHNVECYDKIRLVVDNIKRKDEIIGFSELINEKCEKYGLDKIVLNKYSNKNELKNDLSNYLFANNKVHRFIKDIVDSQKIVNFTYKYEKPQEMAKINNNFEQVQKYLDGVSDILDKSVHGHKNAKKQIERIVGQWVNGEQTGYCFGFEGPPGVGKTSIAKHGLSKCLTDDNGEARPFSFIAIGGSSNGSTLDGHNYTYVGSMWGKIVDILMETKCMNPIIFIDEIDKVSRTETGREIIGILTHLVDPTQNDEFQDKYFTGIDLDLSKALFVFSYNDVSLMDRILLDRIHRIKFDHLSLEDKVTICQDFMLPEIYEKMGQQGNIVIPKDVIEFAVEEYTCEAGVRKMKELMFEIVGEINLEFLKSECEHEFPYELTIKDLKEKYLKNRETIKPKKIHIASEVGIINGLWANALGRGGIIPIETNFVISGSLLDLKLTGMQGDVMKESMSVAKTLAWKLTPDEMKEKLVERFDKTKTQGVHIHCPDGATPKDGPSAGTAITVTLYSLLNNRKIKNTLAITGEMSLQGKVTAIGGLDLKFIGGIQAGVKTFLFPQENEKDFKKFMEKNEKNPVIEGIEFHAIETIEEALQYALEEE